MSVTFPSNRSFKVRAKWSIRISHLATWSYRNSADWVWEKPVFFFSHLFCLAPSVKREKLFVVLDDRSIKFEWSRNWGNEVLKLSDHGRKTSTAAQTTRTKKTWPKKKSGILKGGVLMYDNQRKKEFDFWNFSNQHKAITSAYITKRKNNNKI